MLLHCTIQKTSTHVIFCNDNLSLFHCPSSFCQGGVLAASETWPSITGGDSPVWVFRGSKNCLLCFVKVFICNLRAPPSRLFRRQQRNVVSEGL